MTHLYACLAALALFACGGSDDPTPDAPPAELTACDAARRAVRGGAGAVEVDPDACRGARRAGVVGDVALLPEPGTGTGAAGGMSNIMPAPNNATCMAEYVGTVGTTECGVILAYTPMGPITAGTNYTGVELGCAIRCGTNNTCAANFTPNTQVGTCLCFPNP
ncbi:MAG: hypothetical protein WKG01_15630 [Kofleriaceae bacterium]